MLDEGREGGDVQRIVDSEFGQADRKRLEYSVDLSFRFPRKFEPIDAESGTRCSVIHYATNIDVSWNTVVEYTDSFPTSVRRDAFRAERQRCTTNFTIGKSSGGQGQYYSESAYSTTAQGPV